MGWDGMNVSDSVECDGQKVEVVTWLIFSQQGMMTS